MKLTELLRKTIEVTSVGALLKWTTKQLRIASREIQGGKDEVTFTSYRANGDLDPEMFQLSPRVTYFNEYTEADERNDRIDLERAEDEFEQVLKGRLILKRVRVKTSHATSILPTMISAIQAGANVRAFEVENSLNINDLQHLGTMLSCTRTLESLQLKNAQLRGFQAEIQAPLDDFTKGLAANRSLQKLEIEDLFKPSPLANVSVSLGGLLKQGLMRHPTLESLRIKSGFSLSEESDAMANLFENNKKLKKIDLSDCDMSSDMIAELAAALVKNHTLCELDLRQNPETKNVLPALSRAVFEQAEDAALEKLGLDRPTDEKSMLHYQVITLQMNARRDTRKIKALETENARLLEKTECAKRHYQADRAHKLTARL